MEPVKTHLGSALRQKLGALLVSRGLLSQESLDQALVDAPAAGMRLGEYLIESGLVPEAEVVQALAEQLQVPFVSIDYGALNVDGARFLPLDVALRLKVLPVLQPDGRLVIVVADPTDVLVSDELRMILTSKFDIAVGCPSEISRGIDHVYGSVGVSTLLQDEVFVDAPGQSSYAVEISTEDESAPAVEVVHAILRHAISIEASDIHFIPRRDDLLVRARVDGVLRDLDVVPLALRAAATTRLKVMGKLDIAERRLPQDGRVTISLEGRSMDLRIAVLPTTYGEDVVIRIAYRGAQGERSLETLDLDDRTGTILRRALVQPSGAIVVAAPTGAGKTSTLYAALAHLHDGTRSIVTIEDPVESSIDGLVQIEISPRAGLTFARGLRTILRADPDVILVGEIRDMETAEIALQASMTGHLVLTTMHAETAAAALVRLRQLGIAETTIGSSVRCALSQRLLRRICTSCGAPGTGGPVAVGCADCSYTGYSGRIAVFEALEVTDAVRGTLSASAADVRGAAVGDGMVDLYANALRLVQKNITTMDEVHRVCGEP